MIDPALETLFLPFATSALAWPRDGAALFLNARMGQGLTMGLRAALKGSDPARLLCRQSFKPFADALAAAGCQLIDDDPDEATAPLVLVLPPRQREAARAQLAEAVRLAAPGAAVVAAATNSEGAKSLAADLATLTGTIETLSKNKCRVCWARIDPARIDRARLAEWQASGAPRRIASSDFPGGEFWSRPGLFAWDRIDAGSMLLAEHFPADLAGHGADLGCGVGYLGAALLARCPGMTALDLYEAERMALDLARENLAALAHGIPLAFHWHDVTTGLRRHYDFIVSNPPFHVSREDRADLGQAFIAAAARHLAPGGRFLLVANRHLPYERGLAAAFATTRVLADDGGYKVIEARK